MNSAFRLLLLGFIVFLIGGVGFLLVRNGAFKPVTVTVEDRGALTLLSIRHVGPYHEIMPSLKKAENAARAAGLDCTETFGEFLDDPAATDAARLRSNVGCVLKETPATAPDEFEVRTVPARKYVVANFRGSPALGPFKVYGKAMDEMARLRLAPDGPPIEIYKPLANEGLETLYLFPVR